MGLASLRRLLDPQPLRFPDCRGQTLAVDANNLLWTFTAGMAAGGSPPTGPDGQPISHLLGLVNRLTLYAEHGMGSVWVFDGKQPTLKEGTLEDRRARRDQALEEGTLEESALLTGRQLREARELLELLGVPSIVAPGEADPQCAHLVRQGLADAAVTQDYDILLHGCPLTYRNLTATGRRRPESVALEPVLQREGISREQLVDVAILMGTDYNDGIHGVGPVTALKLVREHHALEGALQARGESIPQGPEIRSLFLDHPVEAVESVENGWPDSEQARAYLGERGMGGKRVDKLLTLLSRL